MFSEMLRDLRVRRGGFETLSAAARALDVRHSAVSRWESGDRVPSAARLAVILDGYGATKRERDRAWALYRAEIEASID